MGICGHNGLRKMGCDLSGYCGSTVAAHDDADTVPGAHLPVGAYIAEKGVLFLGREHLHRVVVLTKVVFFRYGVKVDGIIMHMGPGIHIPGGIADDRIIFPYGLAAGNRPGGNLVADGNICFYRNALLRDKSPGGNGLTGHHDVVRRVQTDHGALPGTFHKIRHSSLFTYTGGAFQCAHRCASFLPQ